MNKKASIIMGIALFAGWLLILASIALIDNNQPVKSNAGRAFEPLPAVYNE